jgi:excisionase family DNA binding protein
MSRFGPRSDKNGWNDDRSAAPSRAARQQADEPPAEDGRWLSIDAACKILGVDQSTLRRWSDSGKIPVFRTPGGHRRYSEDDLRSFMQGEQRPRRRMSRQLLTTMSLSGYERDYLHEASTHSWYHSYDPATLAELRPLGRTMVDLTIRYVSGKGARDEILERSQAIGRQYGFYSSQVGLSTSDALAAFLFFRRPVVHAVIRYIEEENVSTHRAARILSELTDFMDQVLIATITAHREHART